ADLDTGVQIVVGTTVREPDGLAMSSRNAYLEPADRQSASCLTFALDTTARSYKSGERDFKELRRQILEVLQAEPLAKIEYVELVDPGTFIAPGTLAVMAVRIGKTRLIDNADLAQPFPG